MAAGVALLFVISAMVTVVVMRTGTTSTPTVIASPRTVTSPEFSVPSSPEFSAPSSPTISGDPAQQLQAQADADAPTAAGLVDRWVPQLSAKKVGLVADGQTYDASAILADHQALRASYTGALLVWSGDYSSFKGADFWVTVVAQPLSTAEAANAWCSSRGLDADHCYAKRLSHTGGYAGNTRLRTG